MGVCVCGEGGYDIKEEVIYMKNEDRRCKCIPPHHLQILKFGFACSIEIIELVWPLACHFSAHICDRSVL